MLKLAPVPLQDRHQMALENLRENEDASARYKADISNNEALRKELQVALLTDRAGYHSQLVNDSQPTAHAVEASEVLTQVGNARVRRVYGFASSRAL